jgi:mannose-6-phosphate isomerase-like protein (cupin superfamily)
MDDRLTIANASVALTAAAKEFVTLFRHGSLEVEYYRPGEVDRQRPHNRDEVYVIATGSGIFVNAEQRQPFEAGEVLFVPANVPHHFEDYTADFATWVFFYGPEGGEARANS